MSNDRAPAKVDLFMLIDCVFHERSISSQLASSSHILAYDNQSIRVKAEASAWKLYISLGDAAKPSRN
jgi:hypothetical protein